MEVTLIWKYHHPDSGQYVRIRIRIYVNFSSILSSAFYKYTGRVGMINILHK